MMRNSVGKKQFSLFFHGFFIGCVICFSKMAIACDLYKNKIDGLSKLVDIIYINHLSIDMARSIVQQAIDRNDLHLTSLQLSAVEKKMQVILSDRFHAPGGVHSQAVYIYDKGFSEPEICDSLHFYTSSAGKKYIENIDGMSKELAQSVRSSFSEEKLLVNIDDELMKALREQGIKIKKASQK